MLMLLSKAAAAASLSKWHTEASKLLLACGSPSPLLAVGHALSEEDRACQF